MPAWKGVLYRWYVLQTYTTTRDYGNPARISAVGLYVLNVCTPHM